MPAETAAFTAVRIPTSTYRVQFGAAGGMTFTRALGIVAYLHRLGVGDLYASPIFAARPGSTHGYDVTDPTRLNPELGSDDDFSALADALASTAMGLLLDIVPNHMAAHPDNPWWWDVLQNGRASAFAEFFDIRWDDDRAGGGRLVLPVLGQPLEEVLAAGQLQLDLVNTTAGPCLVFRYFDHVFPVDPAHWAMILLPHVESLSTALGRDSQAAAAALTRLVATAGPLPSRNETDPRRLAERHDGVAAIRSALGEFLASDPAAAILLHSALACASAGPDGDAETLSPLASILERQAYRLEFWRTGLEQINYRRFFDISDLAALQGDQPRAFDASHTLVRALLDRGSITGLRIDHIDGLADPLAYLHRLREVAPAETYIVVEKILTRGERLPEQWPVAGTTGYDFLNALSRAFVDPRGLEKIQSHARRTLADPPLGPLFDDTAYEARVHIVEALFPAELRSLAAHLARLPAAGENGRPLATPDELAAAMVATLACMTVYRTYIRRGEEGLELSRVDRASIETALQQASRRDSAPGRAYEALRRALLGDGDAGPPDEETLAFIRRWQQLSGPVMAKGVEDTALYRHITLLSLSEVGGEPEVPHDPVQSVHEFCMRAASGPRPHSMLATSTHDTKRSEDARARLHVLSEIPEQWTAAVERWREMNAACVRTLPSGRRAPSLRDELIIYQSLLAAWPLMTDGADAAAAGGAFVERITAAAIKSAREAKLQTSWHQPDADYEKALSAFVRGILCGDPCSDFAADFLDLFRSIAAAGAMNSLSQLVLKLAAPGVPDFYQGTELWDGSLVDPDNRRPVDFARREELLTGLEERAAADLPGLLEELIRNWPDGRLKLYITWRGLHARREHPDLFLHADWQPLSPSGERANHIIAATRRHADSGRGLIVIAPRLTLSLPRRPGDPFPRGRESWGDTALPITNSPWINVLTGSRIHAGTDGLGVHEALSTLPVALLINASEGRRPGA